jgi:hypothetical protein
LRGAFAGAFAGALLRGAFAGALFLLALLLGGGPPNILFAAFATAFTAPDAAFVTALAAPTAAFATAFTAPATGLEFGATKGGA